MGYDIYIGEWDEGAKSVDPEGTPQTVAHLERPEAPAFEGDDSGRTNVRRPSYGAWERFCGDTGLRELFFDRRVGLMREHPGTTRLTRAHLATIRRALNAYRDAHPNATSTFVSGDERDHHLARLTWLEWWVDWALANCERPAIHNR
jgi:hypothetical protein